MRYLESERLLIKPVEEEDIYQLLEFRWDKDIMQYLVHEPISKQQQQEWFKNISKKDLPLSIFLKEEDGLELSEYAVIGAIVVGVGTAVYLALTGAISNAVQQLTNVVNSANSGS